MLAEHDVEAGIGERQVGDVCLPNGDPLVQPDEPVEPAGCFAVFLGQVDGGDPVIGGVVGDLARRAADPGARVEDCGLRCDPDRVHQLAGGNATHGVKVLELPQI